MSQDNKSSELDAVADKIRTMANLHGVQHVETATDRLANKITELSGDEVELDDIQLLLVTLQRDGHLSGSEAVNLHGEYLQAKYKEPS